MLRDALPGRKAARAPRSAARDAGFTLLEVLVAAIIAALALGVLFRSVVESRTAADAAARYGEAVARARSRLAALEAAPLAASDREGDDGGGYRWRTRVAPLLAGGAPHDDPAPMLFALSVAVSWGDGPARSVRMETRRLGFAPPRAP